MYFPENVLQQPNTALGTLYYYVIFLCVILWSHVMKLWESVCI